MNPIKFIIEKIDQNDFEFVKKYSFFYILIVLTGLVGLYFVFYFNRINLLKNISELTKKKDGIVKIIDEKNSAESKKKNINNLLNSKESFRLKDYVYSSLQKKNFLKYFIQQNENITEQKIKKDYNEFTMNVEFTNVSTAEMLEILAILENDVRVYIKNIYVKNLNNQKLHVVVSLATLQLIST